MKVLVIVLPLVGALVIAGAIAAYFIAAPPELADNYEKKAEPEQVKVEKALVAASDTFTIETFGTVAVSRKLSRRPTRRR
jgi:Flp pilus assembly protein CpaB